MEDAEVDLVIVGAGISGLALAAMCAATGQRALVLERAPRVGGLIDTRQPETAGGFWFELGAHTCYRSYSTVAGLLGQVGLAGAVLPRQRLPYRKWSARAPRRLTAGLRLGPLLARLPRWPWLRREDHSVQGFFTAALGEHNHRAVVGPALDAVMCQDTTEVPASLVLRPRSPAHTSRFPRSYTLAGGLGTLPTALAALPGVTVRLSTSVHGVMGSGRGFHLATSGGAVHTRALALACDAAGARPLLEGLRPGLGTLLPEVAPLMSEAVVVPRQEARLPRLAGLIGQDAAFFSVVTRDPVDDPTVRAFTFHFRAPCLAPERARIMADVLGVPPERWLLRVHKPAGLPAFRAGHAARVRLLDEALAGTELLVTGNYLTGAALEDCVAQSAASFARWQSVRASAGGR